MDSLNLPHGVEINPTAIVCREAVIEGDVRIGPGSVIHPFAVIRAIDGPIIIGENNVIEDRSLIENVGSENAMIIGNENVIEVGSVVRAESIGNNNVLHVQCLVNNGSQLGDGCSIGARCEILQKESLPNRTVIYGQKNERRIASDNPPTPIGQLEIFRKLMPSYHYLRRTIPETKTNT